MMQIRICLVDDHPVVLAGIRALLQVAPEIELVAEANTGADGFKIISEATPDIAVVDLSLPDMHGVELVRRISRHCPQVRIIVLTVHEDRAYIHPALDAGAKAYILKRSAGDELLRAIRIVQQGAVFVDPALGEQSCTNTRHPPEKLETEGGELSPREEDVLRFLAQGFSNKQIAGRLSVSVKSVETYKTRAVEKKGLRSRADIVRFGLKHGWLAPE
jgi:DNA-binding NarL/FixJ family response regulator